MKNFKNLLVEVLNNLVSKITGKEEKAKNYFDLYFKCEDEITKYYFS